jgi:hypothetical protein
VPPDVFEELRFHRKPKDGAPLDSTGPAPAEPH